jgi:hypothetical protein
MMPKKRESAGNPQKFTLLAAAYQAERADAAAIFTNSLALIGFSLTYVAAVAVYATGTSAPNGIILAFAPWPLMALICYQQIMAGMNNARAYGALLLERELAAIIDIDRLYHQKTMKRGWSRPLRTEKSIRFGMGPGAEFLDLSKASWVRTLGSWLSYGIIFCILTFFSVYILILSARHHGGFMVILSAVVTALSFVITGWNMILNARTPEIKN